MARTVTLLELKTQSRIRADKVGSGFIQNDELIAYLNSSACELYDLLVGAYGNDYFLKSHPFSTSANTSDYDLPADFYKMVGIDYLIGSQEALTLKPYQFNERNRYRMGTYWNAITGAAGPRYKINPTAISFLPVPDGAYNMELWYIPTCPKMVVDADTFDGINGWEEFIIVDAAIKMLQKEESDTSLLEKQKLKLEARINLMAENRDAGQSFRVTDVNNVDGFTDGYFEGE
jgi:hypothetical protein